MQPHRHHAAARAPRERGTRTRAAVLDTAERVFAEKGYATTRLEDVAAGVGIRRASLVYYFRDKRALYDEVLARIFGALTERYRRALADCTPRADRMEAIVVAWVGFVAARPAVARLLLWEAAEASRTSRAATHVAPLVGAVRGALTSAERRRRAIDPVHVAFGIIGATAFVLTAAPTLLPAHDARPLGRGQHEAFRREVVDITRRLLADRRVGRGTRPGARRAGAPRSHR